MTGSPGIPPAPASESSPSATPALDALRVSEARFASILEIAADAIISVNEAQTIVHFNHGAEEIFGYSAAEMVGQPLSLLIPARYRSTHGQHVAGFARAPETARRMGERREIFGLRRGGIEFPAEASISKLRTPDGWLFTVVLRDITARKQVEEHQRLLAAAGLALSASLDLEATLRTAVQLPVPALAAWCVLDALVDERRVLRVVSTDASQVPDQAQRVIADAGPAAFAADVPGASSAATGTWQHVDDAWFDRWLPQTSLAGRPLEAEHALVVPLVSRGRTLGTLILIRTHAMPAPDDRTTAAVSALGERITTAIENARLYDAARRATRTRDEVLGIVSHDLRNPVSAIAMCARVLRDTPPEDALARHALAATIYESTEWMGRLIQDLLDVTSLEAGKLSIELRGEDIGPIVRSAIADFAPASREQSLTLHDEIGREIPRVRADASRVRQVLGNLLGNAIKFSPPGGRVRITAAADAREVVVAITDDGPGISAEDFPRLFDRYWHAQQSSTTLGHGLGLAIAKGIVEAHGGRIWVTSGPGPGSTFSFSLPREQPASA